MAVCSFSYRDPHAPCPHMAVDGSNYCLWHNTGIIKSDPYVRDLLKRADASTQGDLAGFHLAGLQWPKAMWPLRNLAHADLRDAHLDGADLSGSDLTGANLKRASLKRVDLRGAQLCGADLSHTNLTEADLRDANLSGAHLSGTILNGCDLRGTNLAGAHIVDFCWNRRTRFAGVKGLEAQKTSSHDGDPTQAFPAPLALADHHETEDSALQDPDPILDKTHVYSPVLTGFITPQQPHAPTDKSPVISFTPWRSRLTVAASLAVAFGSLGFGFWSWSQARSAITPTATNSDTHLAIVVANLQQQHEADLGEMMRLQETLRENTDQATKARQDAAVARAQSDSMRSALRASESDLSRLQTAHDRVIILEQKVAQLTELNANLAKSSARESDIGHILVSGVDKLRDENNNLAKERDQLAIDRTHLATVENELQQARAELAKLSHERDTLLANNQQLSGDLQSAARDIERYLSRVNATHLQDYLTGDNNNIPFLAVEAGKPIALTGDYLLTLRVDHGSQPGTVLTKIVVQRPNSAANPDITVILYDEHRQPLRRLAYSFPHIDVGRPFVASATETACERFPAYARVHISPGLDGLSAKR
jgi:Pentapeptide repeats (8 copies)